MTTRNRTNLSHWTLFLCLTAICFASTACRRLTVPEEKIIGTWEFTGIDATGRIVFRRDHTVVELFPEYDALNARWVPGAWGTWRIEGNEIVWDKEILPIPGMAPSPRRTTRMPIREFREDRLVREEGRSDLIRIRGGVEVYSEVLALLYVNVSLVAFLAAIYAIRKSSFRIEFTLLAVAAFFTLFWSSLTLVAELAQTGTVIVSASWLRSLRVPIEILRVACIVIFTIGFVKLAYRLRVSVPAKDCI